MLILLTGMVLGVCLGFVCAALYARAVVREALAERASKNDDVDELAAALLPAVLVERAIDRGLKPTGAPPQDRLMTAHVRARIVAEEHVREREEARKPLPAPPDVPRMLGDDAADVS